LLFTLALAGLCLWLSGRFSLIAKLVFFVLGVNAAFDLIGAVGTIGGGIAVRIISRRERKPLPAGEKWMIAGTVVKVVDAAISIAVVILLIPRVWR
jgi:hypothetical protein